MNITVDIAELMTYDPDAAGPANFREAVERRAAEMLLDEIEPSIKASIRANLHEMIQKRATEAVAHLVLKACEQPIQRTTEWGEKRGETTTLLEIIREELERFLGNKSGTRHRDAYDKTPRNLKELVEVLVREAITRDFTTEVRKARDEVNGLVKEKAIAAAVATLNGDR